MEGIDLLTPTGCAAVQATAGTGEQLLDDQALVARAMAQPSEFGSLYERYLPRVYAYLRTRTESCEDAADLTQQVFTQALSALPRFRGARDGAFAAWLFRIARNAALDSHRRRRTTIAWDLLPEPLHPTSEQDLEAGALQHEAISRLNAVLSTLRPEQRELLALRFAARLSSSDIGALLGQREAAVKKRLTRLIHQLKEQYRAEPW